MNWHYNKWLSDPPYRREFLDEIKLNHDEIPQHSGVGGGSSFHGTSGSLENNLSQRLMKVEPQKPWNSFLTNVLDDYPEIFTSDEISVAYQFLRKQ